MNELTQDLSNQDLFILFILPGILNLIGILIHRLIYKDKVSSFTILMLITPASSIICSFGGFSFVLITAFCWLFDKLDKFKI